MRKALLVGSLVVGVALVAVAIAAPFLLPEPVYDAIYGWRYPKLWKVGDGVAKDAGPLYAANRYTVELADLRKSEVTSLKLQLTSLPEVEFTLGFDIRARLPGDAILDTKPISAPAHLVVENERGEVVIDQRAPLNQWVWSGAINRKSESFVYARGDEREIPIGAGTIRRERTNLKADEGWGTYFTPRRDGRYTVNLKIQARDSKVQLDDFRLVAYGGGWK
jgi:hypothetical protein